MAKVGVVKYKKVDFNPSRILKMFKAGKTVNEIALAIGYPPNTGQNRTRKVLAAAGVYNGAKAPSKKVGKTKGKTAAASKALARVLTIPVPRDASDRRTFHMKLRESFRFVKNRFDSLQSKQQNAWMDALVGLLLAESGSQVPRTFEPVAVPEQYAGRVAQA